MNNVHKAIVGTVLLAAACGAIASAAGFPPALGRAGKRVVIDCRPGWRGTAVGSYGGVSFGVSCNHGRGQTTIGGTAGTSYSIRMGVESPSVGIDCVFTGDAPSVNETCGEVRLSIR